MVNKKHKWFTEEEYLVIKEKLEEGKTIQDISAEVETSFKAIERAYREWMNSLQESFDKGDEVCYVLNIKGHDKKLVEGFVYKKMENAVIVESEDDYIKKHLNGRVVVSVKEVMKV